MFCNEIIQVGKSSGTGYMTCMKPVWSSHPDGGKCEEHAVRVIPEVLKNEDPANRFEFLRSVTDHELAALVSAKFAREKRERASLKNQLGEFSDRLDKLAEEIRSSYSQLAEELEKISSEIDHVVQ